MAERKDGTMDELFKAFRFKGRQYLAVRHSVDGVIILEPNGASHGSWMTIESFRKHHRDEDPVHITRVDRLSVELAPHRGRVCKS